MNKLIFLCFLVLLTVPIKSEDKEFPKKFEIFEDIEEWEVEEDEGDDFDELLEFPSWRSGHRNKILVNVDAFGAVGDGVSDDTQAFVSAWKQACSSPIKSVFLVPEGRRYLVNATRFRGPCADKIVIQIEGTIVAPHEPKNWDPKNPRMWLDFYNISKAIFQGNGVIDGSGSKWWAESCKKNKSNPCKGAPTALTIDSSSAVRVKGLTIQNSQQMNFVISRSESIRVTGVKVSSPEDSPNTDGIHITGSTNVVVQKFSFPHHSIGSLGKDNSTGIVELVVLDNAFIRGTTNGLRIKTWQVNSRARVWMELWKPTATPLQALVTDIFSLQQNAYHLQE